MYESVATSLFADRPVIWTGPLPRVKARGPGGFVESTSLPFLHFRCMTDRATWGVMQTTHGCGDLIFSSHTTFALVGMLTYTEYGTIFLVKVSFPNVVDPPEFVFLSPFVVIAVVVGVVAEFLCVALFCFVVAVVCLFVCFFFQFFIFFRFLDSLFSGVFFPPRGWVSRACSTSLCPVKQLPFCILPRCVSGVGKDTAHSFC